MVEDCVAFCVTLCPVTEFGYRIIRFVIPVVFIIKLDWSVCICLTQLYDGRDMYRLHYIKNNYIFRHFTLAIFRFISQPEDCQCKMPKHVVVLYVINFIHIYSCVRQIHTLQSR